jgi:hypothetical protein
MHSAVLDCTLWIMTTDAQALALRGDGVAAYSTREVRVLKAMQVRDPEGFDAKLQAIHAIQMILPTLLEAEPAPVVVRAPKVRAPQPKARDANLGPLFPPCPTCGELRHWHDHAGQRWGRETTGFYGRGDRTEIGLPFVDLTYGIPVVDRPCCGQALGAIQASPASADESLRLDSGQSQRNHTTLLPRHSSILRTPSAGK